MAEFKLNEEQKELMKKISDDVSKLIEKYSNMGKAFEVTTNMIKAKMNYCDDERIEDIQEEIEKLKSQTDNVEKALVKINYIAHGYDGYKSATTLLLAAQSLISDVKYELGKLEGYSSRSIYTYTDTSALTRNYEALKKSLLEE